MEKRCEICGRHKEVRNYKGEQFLCGMHREQMRRYGHIRTRTMATRNEFVDLGSHYEMVIYDKNSKEKARAFVDKKDKKKVEEIGSWCLNYGYPYNGRIKQTLHRFLLGKKEGLEIDHINGNKLDNRRINLRFITHAENTKNWIYLYKRKIVSDFKNHLAEGKSIDKFFDDLLK